MFQIEAMERSGSGRNRIVVDHVRGVWLQMLTSIGPEPGTVFKLAWGERVIPFEAVRQEQHQHDFGEVYFLTRFLAFGRSIFAKSHSGIDEYAFESRQERTQAQMLAVEALLIYGGHYDGDKRPEGYNCVEFEGRIYTKRDFGMT
jgi:hypothetical protein